MKVRKRKAQEPSRVIIESTNGENLSVFVEGFDKVTVSIEDLKKVGPLIVLLAGALGRRGKNPGDADVLINNISLAALKGNSRIESYIYKD